MQLVHVRGRSSQPSLVQGNCSDPDAASALGLSAENKVALLPLKPRQCIILVPDTMLMFNPGRFWLDNLYLKLQLTVVSGGFFAFLSVGAPAEDEFQPQGNANDLFLANVTFHGQHRRAAAGVVLHNLYSRVLIQGAEYCCIHALQPRVVSSVCFGQERCPRATGGIVVNLYPNIVKPFEKVAPVWAAVLSRQ